MPRAALAGWTFCIAEAAGGKVIFVSSVFAAPPDRVRLEGEFQAYLSSRGVARPVVQCPAPKDERTDMVNAQTVAVEFHRKLGDTLREVGPAEFAPRR